MCKKIETVCFTGHRPSKLPGGYDYNSNQNLELKKRLEDTILYLIFCGAKNFICGGALGVDQMVCELLLDLRDNGCDIKIELAIPFLNQPSRWNKTNVILHNRHVSAVDKVTYVDRLPSYNKNLPIDIYRIEKLNIRNEYMVDNSDVVVAVWNGCNGGTAACIKYAMDKNKQIIKIRP